MHLLALISFNNMGINVEKKKTCLALLQIDGEGILGLSKLIIPANQPFGEIIDLFPLEYI